MGDKHFFLGIERLMHHDRLPEIEDESEHMRLWRDKHLSVYQSYKQSDGDSKVLKKLDGIQPILDLRIPDSPEIEFVTLEEFQLENKDIKNIYSAWVLISEKKIKIWIKDSIKDKGLLITDFRSVEQPASEIFKLFLDLPVDSNLDKISAAAGRLMRHGIFLYLPDKIILENPVFMQIEASNANLFFPISIWTFLGRESSLKVHISTRSRKGKTSRNILSVNIETILDERAKAEILEIQKTEKKNLYIPLERIFLKRNALLRRFIFERGAAFIKRSLSVNLEEEGGRADLTGIYSPGKNQVIVYDTQQNHLASNTSSDLVFKGVLQKNADTIWKGNVFVEKGTKGADGFQMNNNLLLDPSAKAESIPGLEIIADDVKCSHGVTLSSIDKDQLFYMNSRGINDESAINLIVNGFLQSTETRIDYEGFKVEIEREISRFSVDF